VEAGGRPLRAGGQLRGPGVCLSTLSPKEGALGRAALRLGGWWEGLRPLLTGGRGGFHAVPPCSAPQSSPGLLHCSLFWLGAGHPRTGLNAGGSSGNWAAGRRTVASLPFGFPFGFLEQMKRDPIFPETSSLRSYQRGKLLRAHRDAALAAPRGGIVLQLSLAAAGSLPTFPGLRGARRSPYRGSRCCCAPWRGVRFWRGGSWLGVCAALHGFERDPSRGSSGCWQCEGSGRVRRQGSARLSLGASRQEEAGDPLG